MASALGNTGNEYVFEGVVTYTCVLSKCIYSLHHAPSHKDLAPLTVNLKTMNAMMSNVVKATKTLAA